MRHRIVCGHLHVGPPRAAPFFSNFPKSRALSSPSPPPPTRRPQLTAPNCARPTIVAGDLPCAPAAPARAAPTPRGNASRAPGNLPCALDRRHCPSSRRGLLVLPDAAGRLLPPPGDPQHPRRHQGPPTSTSPAHVPYPPLCNYPAIPRPPLRPRPRSPAPTSSTSPAQVLNLPSLPLRPRCASPFLLSLSYHAC